MRLSRSSAGLVVRIGPGFHAYALAVAALSPLWAVLSEGSISREKLAVTVAISAISLALMGYLVEVAEFRFSPLSHSLHWRGRTAFGRREGTVALGEIEEVRVGSRMNRDDGYLLHSVMITARGRTIPLRREWATGNAGHRVGEAIVDYLAELGYSPRYVTDQPRR